MTDKRSSAFKANVYRHKDKYFLSDLDGSVVSMGFSIASLQNILNNYRGYSGTEQNALGIIESIEDDMIVQVNFASVPEEILYKEAGAAVDAMVSEAAGLINSGFTYDDAIEKVLKQYNSIGNISNRIKVKALVRDSIKNCSKRAFWGLTDKVLIRSEDESKKHLDGRVGVILSREGPDYVVLVDGDLLKLNYRNLNLVSCDISPIQLGIITGSKAPFSYVVGKTVLIEKGEKVSFLDYRDIVGSLLKVSKLLERKDGWHVFSEDGERHLGGPYKNKEDAQERLVQVEKFKHIKKSEAVIKVKDLVPGQVFSYDDQFNETYDAEDDELGDSLSPLSDQSDDEVDLDLNSVEDVEIQSAEHKESGFKLFFKRGDNTVYIKRASDGQKIVYNIVDAESDEERLAYIKAEVEGKRFVEFVNNVIKYAEADKYLELEGDAETINLAYNMALKEGFSGEIRGKGSKLRIFGNPDALQEWVKGTGLTVKVNLKKLGTGESEVLLGYKEFFEKFRPQTSKYEVILDKVFERLKPYNPTIMISGGLDADGIHIELAPEEKDMSAALEALKEVEDLGFSIGPSDDPLYLFFVVPIGGLGFESVDWYNNNTIIEIIEKLKVQSKSLTMFRSSASKNGIDVEFFIDKPPGVEIRWKPDGSITWDLAWDGGSDEKVFDNLELIKENIDNFIKIAIKKAEEIMSLNNKSAADEIVKPDEPKSVQELIDKDKVPTTKSEEVGGHPSVKERSSQDEEVIVGNFRVYVTSAVPDHLMVQNLLTNESKSIGEIEGISTLKELKKYIDGYGEVEMLPRLETAFMSRKKISSISWDVFEKFSQALLRKNAKISSESIVKEFISFYDIEASEKDVARSWNFYKTNASYGIGDKMYKVSGDSVVPGVIIEKKGDSYDIATVEGVVHVNGAELRSIKKKAMQIPCDECESVIDTTENLYSGEGAPYSAVQCPNCKAIYAGLDEAGKLIKWLKKTSVEESDEDDDLSTTVYYQIAEDIASQLNVPIEIDSSGVVRANGSPIGEIKEIDMLDHQYSGYLYVETGAGETLPPYWDPANGEIVLDGEIQLDKEYIEDLITIAMSDPEDNEFE